MITITNKQTSKGALIARIGADKGEANYWITSKYSKRKNNYSLVLCTSSKIKHKCEDFKKLSQEHKTTKIGGGIFTQAQVNKPSDLLLATLFFINTGNRVGIEGFEIPKGEQEQFDKLINEQKVWLL